MASALFCLFLCFAVFYDSLTQFQVDANLLIPVGGVDIFRSAVERNFISAKKTVHP